MNKFLSLFITLLSIFLLGDTYASVPTVTFTKDNVVALNGEVTTSSIDKLILEIESKNAPVIYLFIESPGGDVQAGQVLLDYFKTTDKVIHCVAKVAISMAHIIFESCPVRLVTDSSITMQHNMQAGTQGKIETMRRFVEMLADTELQMDTMEATRIGIPLAKFQLLVKDEWWVYGAKNITLGIADKVVNVKCTKDLYSTTTLSSVDVQTMFGALSIKIKVNGCPLIEPTVVNDDSKQREITTKINVQEEYEKHTGLGTNIPKE